MYERESRSTRHLSVLRGLPPVGALAGLVTATALGFPAALPGTTDSSDVVTANTEVEPEIQSLAVPETPASPEQPKKPRALSLPSAPDGPSGSPTPSDGPSAEKSPSGSPSSPSSSPSPTAPAPEQGRTSAEPSPTPSSGPRVVASLERDRTNDYSMLGITWEPGSAPQDLQVQFRSRGDSGWSAWNDLEPDTDGPTRAEDPSTRAGTQPGWVGDAAGVQVRALSEAGAAPEDLQVDLIDPGESRSPQLAPAAGSTSRPPIYTRDEWGADESLGDRCSSPQYGDTLKGVVVHHTVNSNSYSESKSDDLVRGILAYHTQSRGWCDIGYNFLIDRYGNIFEGRDGGIERNVRGAHAGVFAVNKVMSGISLIGRFDTGYPPRAMQDSLTRLAAWKLSLYDRDPQASTYIDGRRYPVVAGHRDIKSTECPGQHVYDWLPTLRDRIANRLEQSSDEPSAIDEKWKRLGGSDSVVGDPVAAERSMGSGSVRSYEDGKIYWTTGPGAHEVHGSILSRFRTRDEGAGVLGFPVTDVRSQAGGNPRAEKSAFQRGRIYWTPATGAHTVYGSLLGAFDRTRGAAGPLGFPRSEPLQSAGGIASAVKQHYQAGRIYATYRTGAHGLYGPVLDAFDRTRGAAGPLGFPTTDIYGRAGRNPDAQKLATEHGRIYWSQATGAHALWGSLLGAYDRNHGAAGDLGFPTSDVESVAGGQRADFQGGAIFWDRESNESTVYRR